MERVAGHHQAGRAQRTTPAKARSQIRTSRKSACPPQTNLMTRVVSILAKPQMLLKREWRTATIPMGPWSARGALHGTCQSFWRHEPAAGKAQSATTSQRGCGLGRSNSVVKGSLQTAREAVPNLGRRKDTRLCSPKPTISPCGDEIIDSIANKGGHGNEEPRQ